jgi:hypothetical protein
MYLCGAPKASEFVEFSDEAVRKLRLSARRNSSTQFNLLKQIEFFSSVAPQRQFAAFIHAKGKCPFRRAVVEASRAKAAFVRRTICGRQARQRNSS